MGPYQLTFPAEEVQRLLDIISSEPLRGKGQSRSDRTSSACEACPECK